MSSLETTLETMYEAELLKASRDKEKLRIYLSGPEAFRTLIRRFADLRTVCNCGEAYETECPGSEHPEERTCSGCSNTPDGHGFCSGGCSSNQIRAKHEVAGRILDLEKTAA